jgi:Na+/H+-dicarboxylate symporter
VAEISPPAERAAERPRRLVLARRSAVLAAVLVMVIALWGGYGRHWSWTGINGHTATLWDWLHLLLLPIAVGFLPLWLSRRTRVPKKHKVGGLVLLVVFAVVVVAGYAIPWAWTGFVGNHLWDWLELLVLPLAVALSPLMAELRETWTLRHTVVSAVALAAFAAVVLGGYLGDWRWTGFHGNTLWNWLHLWLLPLLIPAVVVPALRPRAMSGVTEVEPASQG